MSVKNDIGAVMTNSDQAIKQWLGDRKNGSRTLRNYFGYITTGPVSGLYHHEGVKAFRVRRGREWVVFSTFNEVGVLAKELGYDFVKLGSQRPCTDLGLFQKKTNGRRTPDFFRMYEDMFEAIIRLESFLQSFNIPAFSVISAEEAASIRYAEIKVIRTMVAFKMIRAKQAVRFTHAAGGAERGFFAATGWRMFSTKAEYTKFMLRNRFPFETYAL